MGFVFFFKDQIDKVLQSSTEVLNRLVKENPKPGNVMYVQKLQKPGS